MPNQIYIKPVKAGMKIYKPDNTVLKAEGELVEDNTFWRRCIRDNEVVIVKKPNDKKD